MDLICKQDGVFVFGLAAICGLIYSIIVFAL